MSVCVVMVGPRLNAIYARRADADAHVAKLIEVNGDQIAVRVEEIEIR
jgi:hypothetical protein